MLPLVVPGGFLEPKGRAYCTLEMPLLLLQHRRGGLTSRHSMRGTLHASGHPVVRARLGDPTWCRKL